MIRSYQDLVRETWRKDQDLNAWIPVSEGQDNRLFDEGYDLRGVSMPYAVVIDTGSSQQGSLGDHTFFEKRALLIRIYATDRTTLLNYSRRFRLVFANLRQVLTEDGCIACPRVTGGQMTRFPDGTREIKYTLNFTVIENRGPSRLRATTQER